MENKKKFSIFAKILIVLLAIRFISHIYVFFLLIVEDLNLFFIVFLGVVSLLIVFYGVSLVGVIKKTPWGINLVMAIAILDIIFTGTIDFIMGTLGNPASVVAIIIDLILLILAENIDKRIRK
jgi:hypothetical protein